MAISGAKKKVWLVLGESIYISNSQKGRWGPMRAEKREWQLGELTERLWPGVVKERKGAGLAACRFEWSRFRMG